MYLGDESKRLSIESKISVITNIEKLMIKLENRVIKKEPNYLLKTYMKCWGPAPRPIYLGQSQPHKVPFHWNYRINCAFGVLKLDCVTPQNPGVLLITRQPTEFLWISGNLIPHYCVPFLGIHIFIKIRQSFFCSRSSTQCITYITIYP